PPPRPPLLPLHAALPIWPEPDVDEALPRSDHLVLGDVKIVVPDEPAPECGQVGEHGEGDEGARAGGEATRAATRARAAAGTHGAGLLGPTALRAHQGPSF